VVAKVREAILGGFASMNPATPDISYR